MSKGKILIIDDETDLLETMSFRLTAAGYEVITAANGLGGVRLAIESRPDMIILDIMMPGIDGFETLRRLKAGDPTKGVPTIICSCGSEEESWAKRSITLGAAGYIVKPFDTSALLFTVEKFIKKKL